MPWAGFARPTPPSTALPRPTSSSSRHALPRGAPFIPALPSLPAPPTPRPSLLFHRAPPLLLATPLYSPGRVFGFFPALSAARRPRAHSAQGTEARRDCGRAGVRALQPSPPPSSGGSLGWWRLQPGISALASAATASIPLEEFLGKPGPEAGIVITEPLRRAAVVPGPALGSRGSFTGGGGATRLAG